MTTRAQRVAAAGGTRTAPGVRSTVCAATFLMAVGSVAAAAEDAADGTNLHLGGFGTFGVVHGNAPPGAGFRRDALERDNNGGTRADVDSRLGVQANYRVSQQVELVGQAVAANRSANTSPSDIVTLAFAAWRPSDELTLHVGRLATDYFLLADYRNVGFAFPFVRPPVETYGGMPYGIDGGDLTYAWHPDDAFWRLRGIAGRARFINDQQGSGVTLAPAYALVLSRDDGNGLLIKGSAVHVTLHTDRAAVAPLLDALRPIGALPVPSVAAEAASFAAVLDLDGQSINYYSLGMSLDRGAWLGSLEVSRAQQTGSPSTSAWGLVGHRWGALTGYAGLSAIHTGRSQTPPQWAGVLTPLIGAAAAAQAQQLGMIAFAAAGASAANQQTATVGARWDFSDRAALKLQWDRVRVDAYGGRLQSSQATTTAIHANVLTATLDFVF